jgi:hypothetical protein
MSFKINTKLTLMSIVAAAFLSVHTTAGDIGKDGTKSTKTRMDGSRGLRIRQRT